MLCGRRGEKALDGFGFGNKQEGVGKFGRDIGEAGGICPADHGADFIAAGACIEVHVGHDLFQGARRSTVWGVRVLPNFRRNLASHLSGPTMMLSRYIVYYSYNRIMLQTRRADLLNDQLFHVFAGFWPFLFIHCRTVLRIWLTRHPSAAQGFGLGKDQATAESHRALGE